MSFLDFLKTTPSDQVGFIFDDKKISYGEFTSAVEIVKNKIKEIPPHSIVVFSGEKNVFWFATFFACIDLKHIIFPAEGQRVINSFDVFQIPYFRIDFSSPNGFNISKVDRALPTDLDLSIFQALPQDSSGLVLQTSGTTGEPKFVLHDLTKLIQRLAGRYNGKVAMPVLRIETIGGVYSVLFTILSKRTYLVLSNHIPEYVCNKIVEHSVDFIPCTPTFIKFIYLSNCWKKNNLACVKRINVGSEPMTEKTVEYSKIAFTNATIYQIYGITECGLFTISKNDTRISLSEEQFLVKDQMLHVRSSYGMLGYIGTKYSEEDRSTSWFSTNDITVVKDNHIQLLGRKSSMVKVGGSQVILNEVADAIGKMDFVLFVKVTAHSNLVLGNSLKANLVVNDSGDEIMMRVQVRKFLRSLGFQKHQIPSEIEIQGFKANDILYKGIC